MTERLYYTDAWLTAFTATVTEVADGGRRVYLDRTAFYPTSGGQPHDLGTLAGHPVVDVVDEGERIAHLLSESLDETGRIEGRIDWPRRFDHMQQHTGQHLLSAVLDSRLGAHTVSVHFGDDVNTVDIDLETLSDGALAEVEHSANEIILENRPVTVSFEEAGEVAGLRKESQRTGTLRIIGIQDTDRSACGGTHVDRTGQIGVLRVLGSERAKRQLRIRFVCGWRALAHDRRNAAIVQLASQVLSAAAPDIPQAVTTLTEQLKDARGTLRKAGAELAQLRAERLVKGTDAGADGIVRIVMSDAAFSANDLRALTQAMGAEPYVRFVAALPEAGMVFVAAGEASGWHAGNVLKSALEAVGGKGGGSPRAAQGSVPDREALQQLLASLEPG